MQNRLTPELLDHLSKVAQHYFTWTPRARAPVEQVRVEVKPAAEGLPSRDALEWLYDLAQHPFRQTTVRDRLLGLSGYRAVKAREELEARGLVRRHVVQIGKTRFVLEEVTEQGYEFLARMQVNLRRPPGKGGYIHKFWQHKVAAWLQREYEGARVKIEDAESGKSVDVSCVMQTKEGRKAIAYEIFITGEEKEVANIRKDLESGFDEVVICLGQAERMERMGERVRRELGEEVAKKVKIAFLSQFLD